MIKEETAKKMSYIYEPRGRAREYAPLALNLYQGCTHGCLYCYGPGCMHRTREQFSACVPREISMEKLRRDCDLLRAAGRTADRVHLCFSCDPYPRGVDTTVTSEAMAVLAQKHQRIQVLTKNPEEALRSDALLYCKYDIPLGVSLSWVDDDLRRRWEPNAPSVHERMRGLVAARSMGIRTWVSLEPVISTSEALSVLRLMHPHACYWKVGKIEHNAEVSRGVDWARFVADVMDVKEQYGLSVMVKESLRAYGTLRTDAECGVTEFVT